MTFAKGHGTNNDFVIVQDRHGLVPIGVEDVQYLCDRRGGIGGDGLLRVTKGGSIPGWDGDPSVWFMDYRNADGSIAEMCGNGLRVFGRYLLDEDLVEDGSVIEVGTRAGLRTIEPLLDGRLRTALGRVELVDDPVEVTITLPGGMVQGTWLATEANVGNPHAICFLDGGVPLTELDLSREPAWTPGRFPEGTHIEFVQPLAERHIAMRVHERGAGETMSCGTGTVAAATAHARRLGLGAGEIRVDVAGGTLVVDLTDVDDHGATASLTGPAVIVARGEVLVPDPAEN